MRGQYERALRVARARSDPGAEQQLGLVRAVRVWVQRPIAGMATAPL
jgi:hypothetical protein